MVFQNNVLAGAGNTSAGAGYTIDQSIRFNDDDTAHMTRTFGSGNQKVWTMSFWVKRGNLGFIQNIISRRTGAGSTSAYLGFNASDKFTFYDPSNGGELLTDAVFRDVSAWYHFVITYEASNSIQPERLRVYVNGTRQTFTTSVAISDANGNFNAAVVHAIGKFQYSNIYYLDAYLAEIVWIDGTALDPSSFGEYNSSNIWIPKDVSGLTFGTNGFYIKGEDSSDLGNDSSGNGNDFTTSGLASNDQVSDSPTNNFAVYNPLVVKNVVNNGATLSEGNLKATAGSGGSDSRHYSATLANHIGISPGKYYFEFYIKNKSSATGDNTNYLGVFRTDASAMGPVYDYKGNVYTNSWQGNGTLTAWSNNDIIGVAMDVSGSESKAQFYLNGSAEGSEYTATGQDDKNEGLTGGVRVQHSGNIIVNFGQDSTFNGNTTAGGNSDGNGIGNFKYSVPSGYLALCTKNLGS